MARHITVKCMLAVVTILYPATALQASDVEALSRLLLPVDMAQNFAMICSLHNPSFLQDASGPGGSMLWYAKHMKEEVIATLPEAEAHAVMVEAADIAKAAALKIVHTMDTGGFVDPARMNAWCASAAKPFIKGTMARHDTEHALLDEMIAKAKH
jgi:hypothetical protein